MTKKEVSTFLIFCVGVSVILAVIFYILCVSDYTTIKLLFISCSIPLSVCYSILAYFVALRHNKNMHVAYKLLFVRVAMFQITLYVGSSFYVMMQSAFISV